MFLNDVFLTFKDETEVTSMFMVFLPCFYLLFFSPGRSLDSLMKGKHQLQVQSMDHRYVHYYVSLFVSMKSFSLTSEKKY